MQGDYVNAIQCFDEVIRLDPEDADAWYYKGVTLELLGRTTEADTAYTKAKELGWAG
jgi:Flp pilus assembly protein TadD